MKKCVLSACSDFDYTRITYAGELIRTLEELDHQVLRSSAAITSRNGLSSQEKAAELSAFFRDPQAARIYDMSGGDSAHRLLPYLDYDAIGKSRTVFYGYSDLTVIHNAIFAKTGKAGVLWSVMNLLRSVSDQQKLILDTPDMYRFQIRFLQGSRMEGVLLGGNIRCFLKLEGTPYFPDLCDRILLLEARSGNADQVRSYFTRLQNLGVFDQVRGVILGTFSALEKDGGDPWELLKGYIQEDLPVAKTDEIGHGANSRAAWIGGYYRLDAALEASEPDWDRLMASSEK